MLRTLSFLLVPTLSLPLLSLVRATGCAPYEETETYIGSSFFQGFSAQSIPDPTHGRVNYVDTATAQSLNLTYGQGDTFIMRADYNNVVSPSAAGRNSVRLQSNKQYTESVMVADIRHMPQGCGTWPAFWTVGDSWPTGGEIDIVEGVNDQGPNQATLHTMPGCTQPSNRNQIGTAVSLNCDATVNSNVGCGVKSTNPNSYGPQFNGNGGGWYVMERTKTAINIWFWARNDPNVPAAINMGLSALDTSQFGTPTAAFVGDSCSIPQFFGPHNIIINLTLCGDWAGAVYNSNGCPGTCDDYVNNNPGAFANAYFEFGSLRIYSPMV